ncbi:MAG: MoaD/ThiS family protein [Chthoniobacterales bacterium]|nr:MoaD/ThiS family protein [Chthoniobacterales bacterium]
MRITAQFFSQLKEIVGAAEREVDLPDGATVADLLAQLYRAHPALERWDRNLLVGAGVEFVGRDYLLQADEQIAIMPPVQGG